MTLLRKILTHTLYVEVDQQDKKLCAGQLRSFVLLDGGMSSHQQLEPGEKIKPLKSGILREHSYFKIILQKGSKLIYHMSDTIARVDNKSSQ